MGSRLATGLGRSLLALPVLLAGLAAVRHPLLDHGDKYSDANVLIAAQAASLDAVRGRSGLPVQQTYLPPGEPVPPYTHYPPGPEWAHLLWRALGLQSLPELRLVSVALSALAGLLMHRAYRRLGPEPVPLLATAAWLWSLPFLALADSLHQHPYALASLALTLLLWLRHEATAPERRGRTLAAAAAAAWADGWWSFENIPLVAVFVAGRAARRPALWRSAIVMWLAPCALVATRLAHNATVLGPAGAVADLVGSDRIEGYGPGLADLWEVWAVRLGFRDLGLDHHDMEIRVPLLAAAVGLPLAALLAWLARPLREREGLRSAAVSAALLMAGAAAWMLVSVTHAVLHPHLGRLLLPGAALLVGTAVATALSAAAGEHRSAPRALAALLGVALAAGWAWQTARSFPFARGWPFAHPAAASVAARHAAQERTAALAASTAGRRAVVVYGNYPYAAAWLAAPWEPAEARAQRLGLERDAAPAIAVDEALWFEAWSAPERARAAEAARRLGFPDLTAWDEPSLLFRGEGRPGVALPVDAGGVVIDAARVAGTPDGRRVLQVRTGPVAAGLELRLEGAPGRHLAGDGAALHFFALDPSREGRRELLVWDEAAGRTSAARARGSLPAGVSLDASGTRIEIDPATLADAKAPGR
jgi:hypothetical protein